MFPRYQSNEGDPEELWRPWGSSVTSTMNAEYTIAFEADVLMNSPIVSITSPSHAAELRQHVDLANDESNKRLRRVYLDGLQRVDQNIVLKIDVESSAEPHAIVEFDEDRGTHAALIRFLPELIDGASSHESPPELIFIVRPLHLT